MNRTGSRKKKLEEQVEAIFSTLSDQKSISDLLLQNLEGILHCKFTDNENGYIIKFLKDSLEVLKYEDFSSDDSSDEKINTTISMKRDVFLLMTSGKLNPQIAMLSHKVKVGGNIKIAMYFFNLFN